MGGFGSAVWESLSDGGAAPRMLRVGLPDRYVTHGAPKLLHEEVGFTPERIAERIEAAVLEPRRGSLALAHPSRRRPGSCSRRKARRMRGGMAIRYARRARRSRTRAAFPRERAPPRRAMARTSSSPTPTHQCTLEHEPRLVVLVVDVQRRDRPSVTGPVLDHQFVGLDQRRDPVARRHAAPAAPVALAALLGDGPEPLPAAVLDLDRGAVPGAA